MRLISFLLRWYFAAAILSFSQIWLCQDREPWVNIKWGSRVIDDCIEYVLFRYVIGSRKLTPPCLLTNQMQNWNPSASGSRAFSRVSCGLLDYWSSLRYLLEIFWLVLIGHFNAGLLGVGFNFRLELEMYFWVRFQWVSSLE